MLKKILIRGGIVLLLLVALFVAVAGPWPTYRDALADIESHAAASTLSDTPEPLQVGWAKRVITSLAQRAAVQ